MRVHCGIMTGRWGAMVAQIQLWIMHNSIRERIQTSVEMDRIRWPIGRGYYTDYEASCEYLIWFLEHKSDYLQEAWLEGEEKKYCTVTFLNYSGDVYAQYTVKKGECLTAAPPITTYVAIFNGWYSVDAGVTSVSLAEQRGENVF